MRAVTREQIEAGPQNIWRYAGLLPVGQDPADRVTLDPGLTPLVRADRLAEELGLTGAALGQGRLGQPDPLVQGPGGLVALTAARGARLHPYRLRLHRQPGQLGRRARGPRRACPRWSSSRRDLEPGKVVQYGGLRRQTLVAVDGSYDDVNRL